MELKENENLYKSIVFLSWECIINNYEKDWFLSLETGNIQRKKRYERSFDFFIS